MECAIIEMVLFHIPDKDIVCVTVQSPLTKTMQPDLPEQQA